MLKRGLLLSFSASLLRCFVLLCYICNILTYKLSMDAKYSIELFEEYDTVNFYTIRRQGDNETEAEKFLLKFPVGGKYDNDINRILAALEQISERGALERYFRPECRYGDGIGAIPIDLGYKVRLYCLRLSDNILIIGNGGIKNVPRWQNSKELSSAVLLLKDIGNFILSRKRKGSIVFAGKEIQGNLNFTRHEKE